MGHTTSSVRNLQDFDSVNTSSLISSFGEWRILYAFLIRLFLAVRDIAVTHHLLPKFSVCFLLRTKERNNDEERDDRRSRTHKTRKPGFGGGNVVRGSLSQKPR